MAHLNRRELAMRGDMKWLTAKDANNQRAVMAFVAMNRDRRSFVAKWALDRHGCE